MRTKELKHFIKERHAIYLRRAEAKPKPWTTDPILQSYRFCNVYRELDATTVWISRNWRTPNDQNPSLWFAMAVARLVNWSPTLELIGYPIPWREKYFKTAINVAYARHGKAFTGAYMVRSDKMPKAEYLAERVLKPLWEARNKVYKEVPEFGKNLGSFYFWLCEQNGLGSFMAGQIIADIKYQSFWENAVDWETFAAPGPGSLRGLNLVFEQPLNQPWEIHKWRHYLHLLKSTEIDPYVKKLGYPPLHAQDLQNCLCETDKYIRGSSRSKYPGAAE